MFFNIKSIVELPYPLKVNVPQIVTVPINCDVMATLPDADLFITIVWSDWIKTAPAIAEYLVIYPWVQFTEGIIQ